MPDRTAQRLTKPESLAIVPPARIPTEQSKSDKISFIISEYLRKLGLNALAVLSIIEFVYIYGFILETISGIAVDKTHNVMISAPSKISSKLEE
jgi:hypothetical protein